jgi:hypothetical protein
MFSGYVYILDTGKLVVGRDLVGMYIRSIYVQVDK